MNTKLKALVSFILFLAINNFSLAREKAQHKYGVITDKKYLCDYCYEVFLPDYWKDFVTKRDPAAKIFNSLEGDWYNDIANLEVLVIPSTPETSLPLSQIAKEAQDEIRAFVFNGGVLVSQNTSNVPDEGDSKNSNMTFIKNIFGFTFDRDDWNSTMTPTSLTLSEIARQRYPTLPIRIDDNFRAMHYIGLDSAFIPIYLYDNKPAVAVAQYGQGGIILFGFANTEKSLGTIQTEVLEHLIQVTKVPVF